MPVTERIVGLTAQARRENKEGCLASGMDHVLIKPVQMKDLFSFDPELPFELNSYSFPPHESAIAERGFLC